MRAADWALVHGLQRDGEEAMSERLLDLLKRALPALRVSKDMARGEKNIRERVKLVRDVEEAIAQGDSIDLELSDLVNEAVKKEDPLEAVETLWREGKRRADAGEHGSKEMQLIAAFIIVRLPGLMAEVRRLRTKPKKKSTRKKTRVATGVCSSCGSTNEFCLKANADLSNVEADCCNCRAPFGKNALGWKDGR